ncbi:MAG: hypothetical protein AB1592_12890 [Pseudomonadota bacterium]
MTALAWIVTNWRLLALAGAVAALAFAGWRIDAAATVRCEAGFLARQARAIEEKTNAATDADDDARRCALDPACRLRDDGWRRD